jgi:hypothetical protein
MRVILFEIYNDKRAALVYESPGPQLSFEELENLKSYIADLIAQKRAMEPKQ